MMCLRKKGQSTVELAVAAPFIFGLLALTLEGGLVLSDQIQLEHYAYEGAQWALANVDTATVDSGGSSGTIGQHIYQQMCGGASAPTSIAGSRFCQPQPTGVPVVVVNVTHRTTPVAFHIPGPIVEVEAAGGCKKWALSVSPATTQTTNPGGTVTYT